MNAGGGVSLMDMGSKSTMLVVVVTARAPIGARRRVKSIFLIKNG